MIKRICTFILACMLCLDVYGESIFEDAPASEEHLFSEDSISPEEGMLSPPKEGSDSSLFLTVESLASVSYDDTPDLATAGTIRYVQQNAGGFYYADYWNGISSSGQCWSCCVSMVLSFLGINRLPGSITSGGCVWGGYGAEYTKTDAESGYDAYIASGCTISPPVIHLPGYSANGHWVVLYSRISDHTYLALDPWNQAEIGPVFEITLDKNTVSYYKGTDQIDDAFQYIL